MSGKEALFHSDVVDQLFQALLTLQFQKDFLSSYEASLQDGTAEEVDPQQQASIQQMQSNEKLRRLQDKINIYVASEEQMYIQSDFNCYMKVRNYRDVPQKSQEARPDQTIASEMTL